jgi:acyl-ACP thioesterase
MSRSAVAALSEMVPPREGGRVFRQLVRPGLGDAAPGGRVRLDALARWLQDVAYDDTADAGIAEGSAWVLRRARLRVTRFPRFGERLELATFSSGLGRMWAERRTSIVREGEADSDVEVVSLWIHMDPVRWRPTPLHPEAVALYRSSTGERRVKARLRHPSPDPDARQRPWVFRESELDVAGHVNNAAYWVPLEDELLTREREGGAEPRAVDAEIEFRGAAQAGEMVLWSAGDRRWIAGAGGELHASIVFELP